MWNEDLNNSKFEFFKKETSSICTMMQQFLYNISTYLKRAFAALIVGRSQRAHEFDPPYHVVLMHALLQIQNISLWAIVIYKFCMSYSQLLVSWSVASVAISYSQLLVL